MTPKEKANELVFNFISIDCGGLSIEFINLDYISDEMKYDPREYALICVDEIIKTNPIMTNSYDYGDSNITYWEKVKNEINKL